MKSNPKYFLMNDVERQSKYSPKYVPNNSLKERILEFLDYYIAPLKLYLLSYPMPDCLWDNRKLRLKASGVQVTPSSEPVHIDDRLIHISQKQPSE
ncbi:uncharacterized protein CELE_ZK637.4 [Caenorhabditis elegans]|uniref:Uncharacterized protein ZK637.4 n=1 Tax=Caenorhabditis elegans TaxID=6239 RepID=YOU4_CAEEL|nr:Uncharacterized protein CELE_ZK637.4 [Caenorhabditis elegans]P30637.1 RecName: Full=Uncharacterized protein ZK637.4 [Caenorhabditis elegans]CAA77451.1 Uncharacterized protein CELE_ZK637.4 [Caenorhabditis elegans]|eukprot:NP_498964.1 Uncharacterized protein CELE_ZK637.4 [Caenorhabditis elegans]